MIRTTDAGDEIGAAVLLVLLVGALLVCIVRLFALRSVQREARALDRVGRLARLPRREGESNRDYAERLVATDWDVVFADRGELDAAVDELRALL